MVSLLHEMVNTIQGIFPGSEHIALAEEWKGGSLKGSF